MKLSIYIALAVSALSFKAIALNVTDISDCPGLQPRAILPRDITDLRVDDIKIFGALGDSIIAGFGMLPINPGVLGFLNINALTEYRGSSYLMGADDGAISVANFMKHYNPYLHGPSTGRHVLSYVRGDFKGVYEPFKDYLNAAQTGAMAMNLHHELDYLVSHLTDPNMVTPSTLKDWKMITIAIGSNDVCRSCSAQFENETTSDLYGKHMEAAIQRIQNEVQNVLINLMGMFKLSDLYGFYDAYPKYCNNRMLIQPCDCFENADGLKKIERLVTEYNIKLEQLAAKYAARPGGTFGVIYTPMTFDINTLPVTALSNLDCFHPSVLGHQWFAKAFWNQLFLNKESKPKVSRYDIMEEIYCPTESDRIQVQ